MSFQPYDYHNRLPSGRYVETGFLWLLLFSLALHLAVFVAGFYLRLQAPAQPEQPPIMIDLEDVPNLPAPSRPAQKPAERFAEKRRRVERQTAPRGDSRAPLAPPRLAETPRPVPPASAGAPAREAAPRAVPRESETARAIPEKSARPAREELFRPRQERSQVPVGQLYPTARRLAQIEENYRRKYSDDVEEGDTRFLDSDDLLFAGFLRRFETAVYGVWRYPSDAARLGIEGVTPVRISFNRKGEITDIKVLESSGSRILDDEVVRTLKAVGVVGSLPKGYQKDEFHLIAFFQYGIIRNPTRSLR